MPPDSNWQSDRAARLFPAFEETALKKNCPLVRAAFNFCTTETSLQPSQVITAICTAGMLSEPSLELPSLTIAAGLVDVSAKTRDDAFLQRVADEMATIEPRVAGIISHVSIHDCGVSDEKRRTALCGAPAHVRQTYLARELHHMDCDLEQGMRTFAYPLDNSQRMMASIAIEDMERTVHKSRTLLPMMANWGDADTIAMAYEQKMSAFTQVLGSYKRQYTAAYAGKCDRAADPEFEM